GALKRVDRRPDDRVIDRLVDLLAEQVHADAAIAQTVDVIVAGDNGAEARPAVGGALLFRMTLKGRLGNGVHGRLLSCCWPGQICRRWPILEISTLDNRS